MTIKRLLYEHRDYLIIYIAPILLLPLPLVVQDPKGLCGYMLLLMATYWCTDAMPLAVTGLIPVFMAPMFKLLTVVQVCTSYLEENTMMLLGGLFVAIALERSDLHRRIALGILKVVGTHQGWLLFGFMFPTWFLSMWISNTATTSMMLPIVEAVLQQLGELPEFQNMGEEQEYETQVITSNMTVYPVVERGASVQLRTIHSLVQLKPNTLQTDVMITGSSTVVIAPAKTESTDPVIFVRPASTGELENSVYDKIAIPQKTVDGIDNAAYEHLELTPLEKTANGEAKELGTTVHPADAEKNDQITTNDAPAKPKTSKAFEELCKGMTMAVAYAASVGGTATLTGTTPNTIMKGAADAIWQEHGYSESPVTYASWLVFGFPVSCINIIFVYLWMRFFYMGCSSFRCNQQEDPIKAERVKQVIINEYEKLGKVRYAEVVVGVMFTLLVLLWFFRSPGFITGWGDLFGKNEEGQKYIGDAVPAILIAVILFCIPMFIPHKNRRFESGKAPALLDWESVHKQFPWSVIFLIGGGFALADACEESGLSEWIGEQFAALGSLPGWLMVGIICIITAFLTEVTSNSATCTILMPIVASMAEYLGLNPLYLMMPVAISTSFAFMLPVATPPNAIAFSYGRIAVIDMVKAGFILNFLCVFSVDIATHTWAYNFFDFGTIPWATNTTAP